MLMIWERRRRPALWIRIARVAAIVGSSVGVAIGAEMLRRKFGIGIPKVEMSREGGNARLRVSLRSRGGGRRRRRADVSGSRS
jgi:hypothetical protein